MKGVQGVKAGSWCRSSEGASVLLGRYQQLGLPFMQRAALTQAVKYRTSPVTTRARPPVCHAVSRRRKNTTVSSAVKTISEPRSI